MFNIKKMNKKYIFSILALLIVLAIISVFYFNKNKGGEEPNKNQNQEQNQNINPENNTETEADKKIKEKILELVEKANQGKVQEALDGYLILLKDNPDNLLLLNNTADAYSDLSNWAKAEEYYKKLLVAHPDFIQGYRMLAYLYEYRFNDDEAKIKILIDDGLAKTNNNPDLLSWIIDYYQQKGEGDKAVPYSEILANKLNKQ